MHAPRASLSFPRSVQQEKSSHPLSSSSEHKFPVLRAKYRCRVRVRDTALIRNYVTGLNALESLRAFSYTTHIITRHFGLDRAWEMRDYLSCLFVIIRRSLWVLKISRCSVPVKVSRWRTEDFYRRPRCVKKSNWQPVTCRSNILRFACFWLTAHPFVSRISRKPWRPLSRKFLTLHDIFSPPHSRVSSSAIIFRAGRGYSGN
jgi:hypothetical protein